MKRNYWVCILALALCAALFTGCAGSAQKAATPTGVTPTGAAQASENAVKPLVSSAPAPQSQASAQSAASVQAAAKQTAGLVGEKPAETTAKETAQKPTASSKPAKKKETEQKTGVSSAAPSATQKNDEEETSSSWQQSCVPPRYPCFKSEQAFQQWLLQGGVVDDGGDYAEYRAQALQELKEGDVLRYNAVPAMMNSSSLTFVELRIVPNYCLFYTFRLADITPAFYGDGKVSVEIDNIGKVQQQEWDAMQEKVATGKNGCWMKKVNGIEYYREPIRNVNGCRIYWKQNGKLICASVGEYAERLDDLLPLLKLEQVTLPAGQVQ